MAEISTLDRASLERFQGELIAAGFNPVAGSVNEWVGPMPAPLARFTSEPTAKLVVRDGWPYVFPKLFAEGISGEHVNADGEVCLWRLGDTSLQWTSWGGFLDRLSEFGEKMQGEFEQADLLLDANLYYAKRNVLKALALIDLALFKKTKRFVDGEQGSFFWAGKRPPTVAIDALGGPEKSQGRWYFRSKLQVPPRDLNGIRAALLPHQQVNFDRWVNSLNEGGNNERRLVVLIWSTAAGNNILVVKVTNIDGVLVDEAYEASPVDIETLALRAGSQAALFGSLNIVLFGAGAIGSHLALVLAESGLRQLTICDGERLRPGNAVRHVAGKSFFGAMKVEAVAFIIGQHAPWTLVEKVADNIWSPARLSTQIANADLVVECTGLTVFADQLSRITEQLKKNFVSAALYRGGAVARVRRQVVARDFPIYRRNERAAAYPIIPVGPQEENVVGIEVGCSSPVINASPISVQSIAGLTARIIQDIILETFHLGEEVIEVYNPIDEKPFDSIGLVRIGAESSPS